MSSGMMTLTYNFSDLLEEGKPKTAPEAKPLRFSLNNIQIVNGSADFLDGPKQTKHKVRDVVIKIPFISDLPHDVDIFVQPLFEAKINDTLVSFKGKTKLFADSHETSFDINMKDFNIPYYLAYVPFKMNYKFLSGFVDTKLAVSYTQHKTKAPTLALTGDITVKQIKVADEKDNPIIGLPLIDISIAVVRPDFPKATSFKASVPIARDRYRQRQGRENKSGGPHSAGLRRKKGTFKTHDNRRR